MHNFDDYLEARSQLQHAQEPGDPSYNPYTWAHNQDGTPVWTIMSQDPSKIATFQVGMSGLEVAIPVVGHFDFSLLKSTDEEHRVQLVDIGGGHGSVLKQILDKHSELDPKKCVLQDLPDVIQMATASRALPDNVVLMPHDFHAEQPVRGAKAYFMRMIMHDYADPVCIAILKQIGKAMEPNSRVLICEMVLPQRVGEANFTAAVLDQCVMTMGGKERTEVGFRSLLESAGMQLFQVWRVPGVPGACVEGRLKI